MIHTTRFRYKNSIKDGRNLEAQVYEISCCICNEMRPVKTLYNVDGIYYICKVCARSEEDAKEIYAVVVSLDKL